VQVHVLGWASLPGEQLPMIRILVVDDDEEVGRLLEHA
jgi:hypothetical protein